MQSNQSAEAFSSLNHKLSQLPKRRTQCSIYRVHEELRNVNNKAYEPNIVAIGPYHRGKDNLKMMEEQKLHFLQLLLECQKQNVERYISAINELEQKARDCYAEPISLSGAKFIEMLVLDGCFIIELVRKSYKPDPTLENDPIFQTQWFGSILVMDLILFENQIPFFVLCKLFDLIEGQDKHHVLINYLLRYFSEVCAPKSNMRYRSRSSLEIKHLLDVVYNSWSSSTDYTYLSIESESSLPLKEASNFIPSATELKDANVEFCRRERDTFFEVKFKNGIMEMPPLTIESDTECLLRNFIVYEQYFLRNQHNLFTDYMVLLDSLINSSRDVEILSRCGIIDIWGGDNELVAKMINELGGTVVCKNEHFVYAKMFDDVNRHYKKGWNRWMAMLRRDIFYSPWEYLSFFAALAILVLTIVQTVCSLLQVV